MFSKFGKLSNAFIVQTLCNGRAVKIPGLLTITFKIIQIEFSARDIILQKNLHILLSSELALRHSLKVKKTSVQLGCELIPEVDLNLSVIAKICKMSRVHVEHCLEENIRAFNRALVCDPHVELGLTKIGRLKDEDEEIEENLLSEARTTLKDEEEEIEENLLSEATTTLKDEEEEIEENLLSEATTTSSFHFNERTSSVLRKSVDSVELTERFGPHIHGQDKEEDLEFERQEPFMSDTEIDEELKMEQEHHSLLERECVVREVIMVWETISRYIIRKIKDGIAVRIPGLGTFTLSIIPNDPHMEEKNKFKLRRLRRFPIFKIAPHIKEMCGLIERNYLYRCNLPVVCMSTAAIASEVKLPRSLVEGIVTETLVAFSRAITTDKDVEFPFPYIGKLFINDGRIYMFFYRLFCESLSFDFTHQMSFFSSVIPGLMTPLHYHRPSHNSTTVFHYGDLKSVDKELRSRTLPYTSGDLIRDDAEDGCSFMQKLFTHSNLPLEGSRERGKCSSLDVREEDDTDFPCDFLKKSRIELRCTQKENFSFRHPDGSTFTPETLFKTGKTGNQNLDRLADDRCLLQQELGRWMKRDFLQSLGEAELEKHFDRDYFRKGLGTKIKSSLDSSSSPENLVTSSSPEEEEEAEEEEEIVKDDEQKRRESDFHRRVDQCIKALVEEDEQDEKVEESEKSMEEPVSPEEVEQSEETGKRRSARKSRKYNNFEVYSGFHYNLQDNAVASKNLSDYHLLSKTPSTSSGVGSPARTRTPSSVKSVSSPSSPICWEMSGPPEL